VKVNIFDWVGDLVSRARHHEIWAQVAQYRAAQYRHVHRSTWEPLSHPTFLTAPSVESDQSQDATPAQYPAAEYQDAHQNTWEPASHSVFVTETRAESYRCPEPSTINPASGLPMISNSGIDILSNSVGFNHSSWDRHDSFASFGHGACGGSLPAGYDPVRGW
jgi:hypothetical protein